MSETISVIVPVYNVEPYLRECVDSILNQTYTNIEVILVDDGSPDNCPAICDEYAQKDHRVQVIHQQNAGVGSARNAGLDLAMETNPDGYITFVDSDDYIDTEMLEVLLNLSKKEDADMVECALVLFKDDYFNRKALSKEVRTFSPKEALNAIIRNQDYWANTPSVHVHHVLCKVHLFKECRFQDANHTEDLAMKCDLCLKANKLVRYHYGYYYYRIMDSSLSRGEYTVQKADHVKMWKYIAERIAASGVDRDLSVFAYGAYYNTLLNHFENCDDRRKDPAFRSLANRFKAELRSEIRNVLHNPNVCKKWQYVFFYISPRLWKMVRSVYKKLAPKKAK